MAQSQLAKAQSQAVARRKLLAAARLARPAISGDGPSLPRGFVLSDPARASQILEIAGRLPRGLGVIYRHFGAADREAVASRLAQICRQRKLVLLIAADPALARAVRADGVHWPLARLRRRRACLNGWLETASAHSRRDVIRAARLGVDAVLLSAVFASDSPSAPTPMGPARFARLIVEAPLPVFALGGITGANAARATTSAAGWAAIGGAIEAWG